MHSLSAGFFLFHLLKVQDSEKCVSLTMDKKFQDDRMISVDRISTLSVVCSSVRCHCLYECARVIDTQTVEHM